jgi:hypothetical protein
MCQWKVAAMVMMCTGTFPLSLPRFRTDLFVVVASSLSFRFRVFILLFTPCTLLNEGWPLARTWAHLRSLSFCGHRPVCGVRAGLEMGFGIDDGLLVPSDAHLHHAGVLCVPQLWLL